ncbi:pilus assembly protein [Bacillus sp. B15-48]|uniref:pilus assembly protein n=1 Tax=Bacillus sp. B15-48 TaxID=1548601 RepID=UPI00193F4D1C|nr:pilus assembly protein [Bacillus sp. B15-48]MBM4763253.1 pilus assembly protein [Bacillus sp. B15-48]
MKVKRMIKNEKGAISIEFLGILPFFFMFFLLLWQVVGTGYAVFTAKTAVNDAAKAYGASDNINEAINAAKDTLGSSNVIEYKNLVPQSLGNGHFKLVLYTDHYLTFVPEKWRQNLPLKLEQEAYGKVLISP